MNHWTFIWTAYALTLLATFGLLAYSLRSMHAAERDAANKGERN
jgi:heme exporter protein CcmD